VTKKVYIPLWIDKTAIFKICNYNSFVYIPLWIDKTVAIIVKKLREEKFTFHYG
jgi:hypothetical protein